MLETTDYSDYRPFSNNRLSKTLRFLIILTVVNSICILFFVITFAILAINSSSLITKGDKFFDSTNDLIMNEVPKQFTFYEKLFTYQNSSVSKVEEIVDSTLRKFDNVLDEYKNKNMTNKIVQITNNLNRITNELNMTFIEDILYGIKVDLDKIVKRIG